MNGKKQGTAGNDGEQQEKTKVALHYSPLPFPNLSLPFPAVHGLSLLFPFPPLPQR